MREASLERNKPSSHEQRAPAVRSTASRSTPTLPIGELVPRDALPHSLVERQVLTDLSIVIRPLHRPAVRARAPNHYFVKFRERQRSPSAALKSLWES